MSAHPDANSYTAAIRDQVVAALGARHEVDLLDLYAEGFVPELSARAHELHTAEPSTKPEIANEVERLLAARMLVLVYPTWWGSQPAILKGWFDRIWTTGVAYDLVPDKALLQGRLSNIRRLVVVTTHGSPKWVNALEGEPGKRLVLRGLRTLCHRWCRTKWLAFYGLDRAGDVERRSFLDRVDRYFARV
ncbi:MAG: NAD(P)H-dependent oxidoreductase [Acidimicrobiales bacterium]|nr:NAD(P)H-dependent oxidoreductase [Acidimicrobiales bacterium]